MEHITLLDMVLRLLAAMAIGIVVGGQRTLTAHPAGLRTHTLVALGSCIVMLTGCLLFQDTKLMYGTGPDPARLGAQVINGIGFLGAGTILRDGISVRGLTTAASLWSVACLGLAAGVGYYKLVVVGCIALFVTLTCFDFLQEKLRQDGHSSLDTQLECDEHLSEILVRLDQLTERYFASLSNLSFRRTSHNTYVLTFRVSFQTKDRLFVQSEFMRELAKTPGILRMDHTGNVT